MVTVVPDERPIPYEIPFREVEHDESMVDDDWGFRTYPIGSTREATWDGDEQDAVEWREEMLRLKESRARLGGFGFRPAA